MLILYRLFIFLYAFAIRFVATLLRNKKAELWLSGREQQTLPTHLKGGIWLHVASLGEFEQARPLIETWRAKEPHTPIILTFFSPSGYEIRKNYALVDAVLYLPLDTQKNAEEFMAAIAPRLAIFVKYEFWYFFLAALKQKQIPTVLISAIFRPNAIFFRPLVGSFFRTMLTTFQHIFVQNNESLLLLKKYGFQNVTTVGDTRLDRVLAIAQNAPIIEKLTQWKNKDQMTLICGSTWQPDERILAIWWHKNHQKEQKYQVIIAPHEIGEAHLKDIEALFPEQTIRYSELKENSQQPILLIDNIGMLSALYQYGEIAYIGGGFGTGIHNILEPSAFGLPVIFGTKYQKFMEAVTLIAEKGAFSIQNETDLSQILLFLQTKENYQQTSKKVQLYTQQNKGATEKIMTYFKKS